MRSIYHLIWAFFKRKRRRAPEELPESVRALVAGEAAFLRGMHGVEVRELAQGEVAGKPKAADSAIEAKLIAREP